MHEVAVVILGMSRLRVKALQRRFHLASCVCWPSRRRLVAILCLFSGSVGAFFIEPIMMPCTQEVYSPDVPGVNFNMVKSTRFWLYFFGFH